MSEVLTLNINELGIADVRLNRPDKYNSLNGSMFTALAEMGKELKQNKDIRAVVLSGEGKGFCAGLDIMSIMSEPGGAAGEKGEKFKPQPGDIANYYQQAGFVWTEIPVPVIAALHGAAYGGGFQLAMGADIRIGRHDTKLSILEIKWGLIPDMSVTATMPSVASLSLAKEMTFTGRSVEAEEALRHGLLNHVVDDHLASAFEMAEVIASKSPEAIRKGKKLLDSTWHLNAEDSMTIEAELQQQILGSKNQTEAVMANMQNRPPIFKSPK